MSRSSPGWEAYERLVARMMADQLQTEYCVTPNARVTGQITRRRRQIDVLIELRHDSDNSRRIIVDAKKHRRRITVNDVEAFEGLMKDVGATHPGDTVRLVTDGVELGDHVEAQSVSVTSQLSDVLGLAMLEGRTFTTSEASDPDARVVNETCCRLWGGESPVGRRVGMAAHNVETLP